MNEKGSALIITMIVFLVLFVLGTSMLFVSYSHAILAKKDINGISASYMAESGIQYIEAVLNNNIEDIMNKYITDKKGMLRILNNNIVNPNANYSEAIDDKGYFIIKYLNVSQSTNDDSTYFLSIASEGHTGQQIYTAYVELKLNFRADLSSKPITVQSWKVIKGRFNANIIQNLLLLR